MNKCITGGARPVALLCLLTWVGVAIGQPSGLVGKWTIVTTGFDSLSGGTSYVEVSIEEGDRGLEAFIYNGPAPLRVSGRQFELDLDWHLNLYHAGVLVRNPPPRPATPNNVALQIGVVATMTRR